MGSMLLEAALVPANGAIGALACLSSANAGWLLAGNPLQHFPCSAACPESKLLSRFPPWTLRHIFPNCLLHGRLHSRANSTVSTLPCQACLLGSRLLLCCTSF